MRRAAPRRSTWRRGAALWFGLLVVAAGATWVLSTANPVGYPARQAAALATRVAGATPALIDDKARANFEKDLLQYQTDNQIKIWTTIVQAVGGAVLLLGLFFTALNLRATQAKLDVDREAQLTNRFTQAVAQLGAEKDGRPNLETRLGGIYTLQRIAQDSPRDYWTILWLLTQYVRENAPWRNAGQGLERGTFPSHSRSAIGRRLIDYAGRIIGQRNNRRGAAEETFSHRPRTDVQAVLYVLERTTRFTPAPAVEGYDPRRPGVSRSKRTAFLLDLSRTDLRGAIVGPISVEGTTFEGADLEGATFEGANLADVSFRDAHLEAAYFGGARLTGVDLRGAHLRGTAFGDAHGLTAEEVLVARDQGAGALLPADWKDEQREAVWRRWRERSVDEWRDEWKKACQEAAGSTP